MKKALIALVLIGTLLFVVGCKARGTEETKEPPANIVNSTEDLVDPKSSTEGEKPQDKKHDIEDAEKISEAISITKNLLANAETCDKIYTGNLKKLAGAPSQSLGEDTYFPLDSKFKTPTQIEEFWKSTFVAEGKAVDFFDKMSENHLYASINGEIHMKEVDELPPLTMGEWNLDTLHIVSFDEETLVVTMETKLVGQPNGQHKLKMENQNGVWLLTESYFLD